MTFDLFVWNYLPGCAEPVLAGRLRLRQGGGAQVGEFLYASRYLKNSAAISIDPVSLPLTESSKQFSTLKGYPGVILDACPDQWGIKAISAVLGIQSYPDGYLLLNDPGRSGSLAFSDCPQSPPVEMASKKWSIVDLLDAATAIEEGREADPQIVLALHPGTGGARPKANIEDDEGVWIAKFPSTKDHPRISQPRLELACMRLARACGIRTPKTRIEIVGEKDVLLVKRFDREGGFRRGFLSARSVFYDDPSFQSGQGSYARLARWLPRYAGAGQDFREELYRRMVFNCCIRNSDDHELNHGLIFDEKSNGFTLSPAYDVVSSLDKKAVHQHPLLIGDSAEGTQESILSEYAAFGIDRPRAIEIFSEISNRIQDEWRGFFYEAGLGDEEIFFMESQFSKLPETRKAERTIRHS